LEPRTFIVHFSSEVTRVTVQWNTSAETAEGRATRSPGRSCAVGAELLRLRLLLLASEMALPAGVATRRAAAGHVTSGGVDGGRQGVHSVFRVRMMGSLFGLFPFKCPMASTGCSTATCSM
jgi:hypothetical protein